MKLGEADLEQSYFPSTPKATDKTAGYILAGLTVLFFFSLYLFGLDRVQTVSDQVVGSRTPPLEETKAEISDSVDRTGP